MATRNAKKQGESIVRNQPTAARKAVRPNEKTGKNHHGRSWHLKKKNQRESEKKRKNLANKKEITTVPAQRSWTPRLKGKGGGALNEGERKKKKRKSGRGYATLGIPEGVKRRGLGGEGK